MRSISNIFLLDMTISKEEDIQIYETGVEVYQLLRLTAVIVCPAPL